MCSARRFAFLASVAALAGALGAAPARAEDPDLGQVYSTLKSLQSRIASLEAENREVKRETASSRAEAQALRRKLAAAPAAGAPAMAIPATAVAAASQSYARAAPPGAPPVPSWAGFYAGAAFGLASLRAGVDQTDHSALNETATSIPPGFSEVVTQTFDSATTLHGRNIGAAANLFLGYNFLAGDRFVVGGQVEGGVSNMRVNLSGTRTSAATTTAVLTPPGGVAGTFSSTQVSNSTASDVLDQRWMVSALARAGILLDPVDYLYAIGGYTYGRFALGQSFGLNGGTVGAGWERQLAPGWTFRAEGRYTKFEGKNLADTSAANITSTSINAGVPTAAFAINTTDTTLTHISPDMWSIWLGVSHYFN